jgi:hypothetical protein
MSSPILIALSLVLSAGSAAAENFPCPALSLPSGKQAPAQSLSIFEGPPSEMADLAPDNADTNSKLPYYWTFTGHEYAIWVMCHYKGSRLTHQFALPKAFKKCRAAGPLNAGSGLSCE